MLPGDLLARELVADDAEREREDAAAGALDEARHARSRRSELETAASSVPAARITSVHSSRRSLPYMSPRRPMIAVPDRRRQQVGGQQPGDLRLARVQRALDRRQRGHHRGAQHRVGHPASESTAGSASGACVSGSSRSWAGGARTAGRRTACCQPRTGSPRYLPAARRARRQAQHCRRRGGHLKIKPPLNKRLAVLQEARSRCGSCSSS